MISIYCQAATSGEKNQSQLKTGSRDVPTKIRIYIRIGNKLID